MTFGKKILFRGFLSSFGATIHVYVQVEHLEKRSKKKLKGSRPFFISTIKTKSLEFGRASKPFQFLVYKFLCLIAIIIWCVYAFLQSVILSSFFVLAGGLLFYSYSDLVLVPKTNSLSSLVAVVGRV